MGAAPLTIAEQSIHFLDRVHREPPSGEVRSPAAWRADELGPPERWAVQFPEAAIGAFERSFEAIRRAGKRSAQLSAEDFVLEPVRDEVEAWKAEVLYGRGLVLIRGALVHRWDLDTQKLFMCGLGLQFGHLGYQNPQGDLIGEVRDTGADKRDPFARKYATAAEFKFHCDASDLLGLLCVRPAASGGESRVASSVTVYNELQRRRPDLARRLFEPMRFDLRNEQAPGTEPTSAVAPCAFDGERLKTFYISDYFRTAGRHGTPLMREEAELLDVYDGIAGEPEIGLAYDLEPGDVQVLNNHVTLHARTAFQDAPGRERLLLRFLASVDA